MIFARYRNGNKTSTLTLIAWGLFASFCIHLFDESPLGGGSVATVQRHFWPGYSVAWFAVINIIMILLIGIGNFLAGKYHGFWDSIPMFWIWERSWNEM